MPAPHPDQQPMRTRDHCVDSTRLSTHLPVSLWAARACLDLSPCAEMAEHAVLGSLASMAHEHRGRKP